MIVKRNGKYLLLDADGKKVLGTHDSFQKAVKQEYAIGKSMGKSKEEIQKLIKTEVARNYKKASVSNGYVALKVAEPDANKLSNVFNSLGLTGLIPPDKMHMTLMYDKKEGPKDYTPNGKSYKAKVLGIDRLGKKGSKWEAIVLKVHSPAIDTRHEELKNQGFKHSYNKLIQHISIKYKPSSMDTALAKKAINVIKNKLPEITLENEFTEPLNEKPAKKAFVMNNLAQEVLERANVKMANLIHYQHGEGIITPSLAQLADTNPEEANKVLQRLIDEGYRKPGYLGHRKEVEDLLRDRAATLGIDIKYQYPTYAVLGSPLDKTIFRGESHVALPLNDLKDKTTFTIGDSFRVYGKTPDGNERDLAFPDAMSYADIQRVMSSPEMQKQLHRAGKGAYIEAQIWEDPKVLEKLTKTAMIKLRPFKELKSIKRPWYKRLLAKKIAPNNPDIQNALRQAMPGTSGRLSRILQKMTDVENIS